MELDLKRVQAEKEESARRDYMKRQSRDDSQTIASVTSVFITRDIKYKYDRVKQLGKGGYSVVNLMKHISDGEMVAVKTLKKREFNVSAMDKKLGRELRVLLDADHPNLVKLHELYKD